ncbi:MAG: NAD(P)-binding protein [Pseudomonadota bacterium]
MGSTTMVENVPNCAGRRNEDTTDVFDLVVIGAGIAGLNALYAATDYLPQTAKVLLLDEKQDAGGMWNTTYDFVRLHQPHPMFTVGDMRWDWQKPKQYLARRDEVREHLARSLDRVAGRVHLETSFGQVMTAREEIKTCERYRARVVFHPVGDENAQQIVLAKRAIYAPGLNHRAADPLALSSGLVHSITPYDLIPTLERLPDAAVYVVGGGKTGMDTILATLDQDPTRAVFLINGSGTNFLNRTKYLPTGIKRWISGAPMSQVFRDIARFYDGDNEEETIARIRTHHSTDVASENQAFLYGLQSEDELARVKAGLQGCMGGYLSDAIDTPDGPSLEFRDGETAKVQAGSIFVNCTGSFFTAPQMAEALPCVSDQQTLVTVNGRDGFHCLTSVAGFFVAHLAYRNALKGNGFYTLDHEALFRQNRNAWVGASATQAYMNQVLALQTLPLRLLDRCRLDLDRWYPLPRRLAGLIRILAGAREDIAHCRNTLDRVAERFEVSCKPLS